MAPVSLSLSSSLLSFTHSLLCIINKPARVRGIFPSLTFPPRNRRRYLWFGASLEVSMVTQRTDVSSGTKRGPNL